MACKEVKRSKGSFGEKNLDNLRAETSERGGNKMKKLLPLMFFSILVLVGYAHGQFAPEALRITKEELKEMLGNSNGYETFTGNVSFNIKVTELYVDSSDNEKFHKYPIPFDGKIYLFVPKDGPPVQNGNGYYIEFRDEGNQVIVGIKEITAISTDYVKLGKSNKFLLVGTGDFYHPQTFLKGIAYIDANGTLKEDSMGELSSISISGKIGGGMNAEALSDPMTFSASFKSSITGDVIIIDVRTDFAWQTSELKIMGAVREDPNNVNSWISKYPKDKTLVFY